MIRRVFVVAVVVALIALISLLSSPQTEHRSSSASGQARADGQKDQTNVGLASTDAGMGPDSEAAKQFPSLFAKAKEKREPNAQYFLGIRYGFGEGLGKDFEAAVNWLCEAADQGHGDAQFALGQMYFRGTARPPDYNPDFVRAHMWWRLAAKQDHAQAVSMSDKILSLMSPVELDDAQKLVDEWQPGQCGAHSDAAEPQK